MLSTNPRSVLEGLFVAIWGLSVYLWLTQTGQGGVGLGFFQPVEMSRSFPRQAFCRVGLFFQPAGAVLPVGAFPLHGWRPLAAACISEARQGEMTFACSSRAMTSIAVRLWLVRSSTSLASALPMVWKTSGNEMHPILGKERSQNLRVQNPQAGYGRAKNCGYLFFASGLFGSRVQFFPIPKIVCNSNCVLPRDPKDLKALIGFIYCLIRT